MPTISQQSSFFITDLRNRRQLASFAARYAVDSVTTKTISLTAGETETVVIDNVFAGSFSKPTLIQVRNADNVALDLTVVGMVVLPITGTISIINPADTTATDPTTCTFVVG